MACAVVDAGEHRVFETDAALPREVVFAKQADDLLQRPAFLDRHQRGAFCREGIMEAHGQVTVAFVEEMRQDGQDADGGERHALRAPAQPPVGRDDRQGSRDLRPVVERFAHAHEDGVGQLLRFVDAQQLGENLGRGKLTVEAAPAGHAEAAAHLAADLRGDAGRGAGQPPFRSVLILRDHHGLDVFAGNAGGKEILPRAVARSEGLHGCGAPHFVALGERGAGGFRQVGHRLEIRHALLVNPLRELLARIGRQARLQGDFLQFGSRFSQ